MNSSTALKKINATSGRVMNRKMRRIGAGASSSRNSHTGIPAMRIGAATSVNSRCWVMCMLYR